MPVTDISAALRAMLAEALAEQAFTDGIGFDVSWTPGVNGGPPFYHLLFTMRSPLLGHPPLYAVTTVQTATPHEIGVDGARDLAAGVLRGLRAERAAVLSGQN